MNIRTLEIHQFNSSKLNVSGALNHLGTLSQHVKMNKNPSICNYCVANKVFNSKLEGLYLELTTKKGNNNDNRRRNCTTIYPPSYSGNK